MSNIANILLSAAMIIAPTIGYFDEYRIILKNKTSQGFNSATCAILCFANILRIFFWFVTDIHKEMAVTELLSPCNRFGKRFDITLLFQSIAMLAAILLLLHLVIRYKTRQVPSLLILQDSISSDEDEALEQHIDLKRYQCRFWDWDHYVDYINFLLAFTVVVGLLYLFLHRYSAFIEILGYLSLGIESTLPLPQVITNYKLQTTNGFSPLILASWFLGDSFKLFYFIYESSPTQFVACALIQLSFDTIIVFQFIFTFIREKKGILLPEEDDDEIIV